MRLILPLAVLVTGLFVTTTTSFAKPEYMKKEKAKNCVVCHTAAGKKDLNDVGKCYAKKHVMEGCETAKK
jgi:hypothetical protein